MRGLWRCIVLDGGGRPAAIIETLTVRVRRFDEVDEIFATAEGGGLRTLTDWRDGHKRYFERNGGFSPAMELLCERVEVHDRNQSAGTLDNGSKPE